MGARWTEQEKQLGLECKTVEELFLRYSKEIGDTTLSRVKSIWSHRSSLIKEQMMAKAKASLAVRESATAQRERVAFPDEAESLAHISNKLSELIELQKESFERQRELLVQLQGIHAQMNGLLVLFQRLAARQLKPEVKDESPTV